MKTVRNVTQNPLKVLVLCSLLFCFSCGRQNVGTSISQYSGKELMQAIYFMNGDAVNLIEPLRDFRLDKNFNTKQVNEINSYVSSFLDSFENENPGSFENFRKQMTSGDHSLIGEAVDAHAKALLAHLNKTIISQPSLALKSERSLAHVIDAQSEILEQNEPLNSDLLSFQGLDIQLEKRNETEFFSGRQVAANIVVDYDVLQVYVIEMADATAVWAMWEDGKWIAKNESEKNNLMREQIINSVASNWARV